MAHMVVGGKGGGSKAELIGRERRGYRGSGRHEERVSIKNK